MPPVTLLSKPNCGTCIAVEYEFKKNNIPYEKIDMSKDPEALDRAISLGHRAAPVTIVGDKSWGGLAEGMIDELKSVYAAA